jgi:hypothetical protein
MSFPRSAYDTVSGLLYFPRMLHKIRLHAAGELPSEYTAFLGEGFDGRMCRFLKISYADVTAQALAHDNDAEVLEWCFSQGFRPTEEEIHIYNKYQSKLGWRDDDTGASGRLKAFKDASGLSAREDIQTFFDYYEVDEQRRA